MKSAETHLEQSRHLTLSERRGFTEVEGGASREHPLPMTRGLSCSLDAHVSEGRCHVFAVLHLHVAEEEGAVSPGFRKAEKSFHQ